MLKNCLKILLLLFVLQCNNVFSQNPSDTINLALKPWSLVLKVNGIKYIGKIISDDGREILIDTKELGKIYIKKSEIKSITEIDDERKIVSGELQTESHFTTRYFLTTNALPIKKGQNYALIHLYGPEFHFSVANNLSIGIMASWIASPLALALKYNIKTNNEKLNFSLGAIGGSMGYINSNYFSNTTSTFNFFEGFGAVVFGNVTIGDRSNNLTLSVGGATFKSGFNINYKSKVTYNYIDTINDGYDYSSSYTYDDRIRYQRPQNYAFLASLAGIKKLSEKVSVVFDLIYSNTNITRPAIEQTINYYNAYYNYNYNNITLAKYNRTIISFMPAIRFSFNNKAFQLTLGNIHKFEGGKRYSFPLPMCTWFIKL